jgi:hypothetical protein
VAGRALGLAQRRLCLGTGWLGRGAARLALDSWTMDSCRRRLDIRRRALGQMNQICMLQLKGGPSLEAAADVYAYTVT